MLKKVLEVKKNLLIKVEYSLFFCLGLLVFIHKIFFKIVIVRRLNNYCSKGKLKAVM